MKNLKDKNLYVAAGLGSDGTTIDTLPENIDFGGA